MNKLLYAELHRFLRFKLYWVACAAVILFSVYFVLLQEYSVPPDAESFLFYCMPVLGAVSAIVISQFIGTEYSCGTIRNKLFTGHTRTEMYLAELIVAFLGNIHLLHLAIIFVVISNRIRQYQYSCSFTVLLGCYAMCVCTLFLVSAISVLVSCLNSSNMASLIVLLAVWLCFSMIGSDCTSKLREPEMRKPYEFEIAEGQTEPLPNDLYVSGEMRRVNEFMLLINPYGHTSYEFESMYDRYQEYEFSKILAHPLPKIFIFSVVEGMAFTAIGLTGFRKKEIK